MTFQHETCIFLGLLDYSKECLENEALKRGLTFRMSVLESLEATIVFENNIYFFFVLPISKNPAIRETQNLSNDADSSTDTFLSAGVTTRG